VTDAGAGPPVRGAPRHGEAVSPEQDAGPGVADDLGESGEPVAPGAGLAHGLGSELVPADWPPLGCDEVAGVLAAFGLPGDGRAGDVRGVRPVLRWHSPRPFSAAAIVALGRRSVFVKRHALARRDPRSLAEEHAFLAHLAREGLVVPRVRRTADGATALVVGRWCYEVHDVLAGLDRYRDVPSWVPLHSATDAAALGRLLGSLRAAAAGFAAPVRGPAPLIARFELLRAPDVLVALESALDHRPSLAASLAGRNWRTALERDVVPAHERLVALLDALEPAWTHNDLHASNVIWRPDGGGFEAVGLFDAGLADRTTPMFDLATALERNTIAWLDLDADGDGDGDGKADGVGVGVGADVARPNLAHALLAGYRERAALSPLERRALVALLPVVHVELALAEMEYYQGILGDPERATVAYERFLLGHAAWFAGPAGRDYLGTIERSLEEPVAAA